MDRFQLVSPKRIRRISTKARSLITASRAWLISVAVGVITGAAVGGLIAGLDYAAFIADLHHRHEIDAFAFNYLDFLRNHVVEGAVIGAACGAIGAVGAVSVVLRVLEDPRVRKLFARLAGGAVIAGVLACVAFVVLAAVGIAVRGPIGPQGAVTPGDFLISLCGCAAGLAVGTTRTDG